MHFFSRAMVESQLKITRRIFSLLVVCVLFLAGCKTLTSSENSKEPPATLVLGIDGISYFTFQRMIAEGKLPLFKKVAPMVASFPSLSDPSWSKILRVDPPNGYTKEYFDRTKKTSEGEGKEFGSVLSHIEETPLYETGFDHHIRGIMGHVTSMAWLTTSARIWIEELTDHFFRAHDRKFFYAFNLNSDLISHTQGEAAVEDFLLRLEYQLERIDQRMKMITTVPFEIVMISDHGNEFLVPQNVKFEEPLAKSGWKWKSYLNQKTEYAFTAPEIISFGSFYTLAGSEKEFARELSKVDGIEDTVYEVNANTVHAFTEKGADEAEVVVNASARTIQFKVLKGRDYFGQQKYFSKGPLTFDAYFKLSQNDLYPYAAVRLWEGFHGNCKLPGSVLASTLLGFAFGNPTLEILTAFKGLRSMHGGLRKNETWGIFASSIRDFPAIRPEDFATWVDLREYRANLAK